MTCTASKTRQWIYTGLLGRPNPDNPSEGGKGYTNTNIQYINNQVFKPDSEQLACVQFLVNCFIPKHYYQNQRHSRSATLQRLGCVSLRRDQCLCSRVALTPLVRAGWSSEAPSAAVSCHFTSPSRINTCQQGELTEEKPPACYITVIAVDIVWLNHKCKIAIKCNAFINLSEEVYGWKCLYLTLLCKIASSVLSVSSESQCLQNSKYQQSQLLEMHAGRNSFVALLFILSITPCPGLNMSHFCHFLYSLPVFHQSFLPLFSFTVSVPQI